MLRTNLSTRPFYNDRAVRVGIALAAVLAAALTTFNVAEVWSLNRRNGELATRADDAERRAGELRQQAAAIRKTLDQGDVSEVLLAAREANVLIDRRAFSWTDLFNRFEETLPDEVRIAAIAPQVDAEGRMLVAVTVVSRRIEDLDRFIEQLEQTGAFRGVLSRQEQRQDDGMLRSIIQGYYGPPPAGAQPLSAAPAPAERAGNGSAAGPGGSR